MYATIVIAVDYYRYKILNRNLEIVVDEIIANRKLTKAHNAMIRHAVATTRL